MKAKLIQVIEEAEGVKTFILAPKEKINFVAGQYASFSIKKDDKTLLRIFSFSSPPTKEYVSFTTIISESEFKQTINQMQLGMEIEIGSPTGEFTLNQAKGQDVVFLAGGIGITPIKSMIDFVLENKIDKEITLFYANKTIKRIVFKKEFKKAENKNGRIKVVNVLSQEEKVPSGSEMGRINKEILQKYLGEVADKMFYLVGPPAFVSAMEQLLNEMQILKTNIIKESFSGY